MKQKHIALSLLLCILPCILNAQESKLVIQLNPFFIEGIGQEESLLIESLVEDYLSDIGEVISLLHARPENYGAARRTDTIRGQAARPPDYTISGNIRLEQDGPVFLLEITNTRTGERISFTSVYKSTGELALKARSVLESAFSAGNLEAAQKTEMKAEALNENRIVGAWKGEPGIEIIRLQRGSRGVAIFSSGAQMVLSYTIENNVLKITQISPNSERFYYPLPQEIARQLAADADPITWELSLYQQGTVLKGVRLGTAARMENGMVAELLPAGDVREITWTKAGH
jgi:hypothetical protein